MIYWVCCLCFDSNKSETLSQYSLSIRFPGLIYEQGLRPSVYSHVPENMRWRKSQFMYIQSNSMIYRPIWYGIEYIAVLRIVGYKQAPYMYLPWRASYEVTIVTILGPNGRALMTPLSYTVYLLFGTVYYTVCSALFLRYALNTVHSTNIMHSKRSVICDHPAVFSWYC